MSVFSRRGVRATGPYTNTYGNERDGFNSPSRYSHKHREMTPNPYRKREVDLGKYTGQRQRNTVGGTSAFGASRYGGYTPGTQLESGKTYYERIYLDDMSGRGLRAWREFMTHSKEEWQTVQKVKRLITGKRFRGNTVNLPGNASGITLLVDMDETLIHSEEWRPNVRYDETVEIVNPMGRVEKIGVYVRPYCLEFLERMSQKFEVAVFTAAREDYASKVIDKLDPTGKLISGRLYRQHCSNAAGTLVKDFRVIGNRRPENIILVDNLIYSFAADLDNGIHIKSYVNGRDDYELEYLSNVLDKLSFGESIGQFIDTNFRFKQWYQKL
jgi:Dullard-like phosphatase family protein